LDAATARRTSEPSDDREGRVRREFFHWERRGVPVVRN